MPAPTTQATSRDLPSSRAENQALLSLVDEELGASRQRLDDALRPVGFALRDLALRLVAAESTQRGTGTPPKQTSVPGRVDAGANSAPEPEDGGARPEPIPPLGSLAPRIDPADLAPLAPPAPPSTGGVAVVDPVPDAANGPVAEDVERWDVVEQDASGSPAKSPAVLNERPDFQGRPAPIPPTGALGPLDLTGIEPPPDPVADIVRFNGFQGGYESNPVEARADAKAVTTRKAFRAAKLAAAIFPILILGSGVAAYFLADQAGLGPTRDKIRGIVLRHADSVKRTLGDAYQGLEHELTATIDVVRRRTEEPDRLASAPNPVPSPEAVAEPTQEPAGNTPPRNAVVSPPPKSKASGIAPAPGGEQSTSGTVRKELAPPPSPDITTKSASDAGPASKTTPPAPAGTEKAPQIAMRPPAPRFNPPAPPTLPAAPPMPLRELPGAPSKGAERIAWLETRARAGDASAQHELARHLIEGDGVERDYAAASNWLREAAIQGVANAQYNLGVLYERGLGVTKDDVRALLWYHSAAEQSHPLAQYNLGNFYLQGRGIPLSYAEAVHWFKAASEQGVAKATYNLAVLTEDGLSMKADKKRALELYEKAAEAGDPSAAARLAVLRKSDTEKAKPKPAIFADTANTQAEGATLGTTVSDIQTVLLQDGLYTGRVDGIAGPKTRTAIRAYQREHDLPVTGIPSESLLDYMRGSGQRQSSG